jgi:hypothetical protein
VTFTADSNGSLAETDTFTKTGEAFVVTVDDGTTWDQVNKPGTTGNSGYTFDKWTKTVNSVTTDCADTDEISATTNITAVFKYGTYTVTLNTSDGAVTYSDITNISEGKGTYMTDVSFKVALTNSDAAKAITGVYYTVGNSEEKNYLTATEGKYTIEGKYITDSISVTVELTDTYVVTFQVADSTNGGLRFGDTGDATSSVTTSVVNGGTVTTLPNVVPAAGYKFSGWKLVNEDKTETDKNDSDITSATVTKATTYVAYFTNATYEFTATGISGISGTPTHGTDFKFTPTVDGKIVTKVTYTVGEDTTEYVADPVTKTETVNDGEQTVNTGEYKIPGANITGDLTISVTTIDGAITFINNETYMALVNGTKIAVISVAELSEEAGKYTLQGGSDFYWSSKYNSGNGAYVVIVSSGMTETELAARLIQQNDGSNDEIGYKGDVSGANGVNAFDAGVVNDLLFQSAGYATDKQRLEADVNGDGTVSTQDISTIVKSLLGTTTTSTEGTGN